jgi:predicted  nucleic acid-binding Zn-ribbon protein
VSRFLFPFSSLTKNKIGREKDMTQRRRKPTTRVSTLTISRHLRALQSSTIQTQKQLEEIQSDLVEIKDKINEQGKKKEKSKKKGKEHTPSTDFDFTTILELLPLIQSLMNVENKKKTTG